MTRPELEAVARAICRVQDFGGDENWPQFLPEARAAVAAFVDALEDQGYRGIAGPGGALREIATFDVEPSEILLRHELRRKEALASGHTRHTCACGLVADSPEGRSSGIFAKHVTTELRIAGLLKEGDDD